MVISRQCSDATDRELSITFKNSVWAYSLRAVFIHIGFSRYDRALDRWNKIYRHLTALPFRSPHCYLPLATLFLFFRHLGCGPDPNSGLIVSSLSVYGLVVVVTMALLRILCQAMVAVCLLSISLFNAEGAAVDMSDSSCKKDFYLDHGTKKCEHCCDICCNADIKGTVESCQRQCPAFADIGKLITTSQSAVTTKIGTPGKDTTEDHMSPIVIAAIVVGLALVIVLSILGVLLNRKAIINRLKGARGRTEAGSQHARAGVPERDAEASRNLIERPAQVTDPTPWLTGPPQGIDVRDLLRPREESRDGRAGGQAIALTRPCLNTDEDEVEPKTLMAPVHRPLGLVMTATREN